MTSMVILYCCDDFVMLGMPKLLFWWRKWQMPTTITLRPALNFPTWDIRGCDTTKYNDTSTTALI